jgi:integrase
MRWPGTDHPIVFFTKGKGEVIMAKQRRYERKYQTEFQVAKIFKTANQRSFKTRYRYWDSANQFARFLSVEFKVQNLKNMAPKHIVAFVEYRQAQRISPKTLKNDLSALRYLHDHLPNPRYKHFPTNEELKEKYGVNLEKVTAHKGNRAWTDEEYANFRQLAAETGNQRWADAMAVSRTMGLRVAEVCGMTRAQAEEALRTGVYQVKNEAKNGKWRKGPLRPEAKEVLEKILPSVPRGHRVFVREGENVHQTVKDLQKFIINHRQQIETSEGIALRTYIHDEEEKIWPLSMHGLRYMYVQERIQEETDRGLSIINASEMIAREVGHERIKVLNIYLGGMH